MNRFATLPRHLHLAIGSLARRQQRHPHVDWSLLGFWAGYFMLFVGVVGGAVSWM